MDHSHPHEPSAKAPRPQITLLASEAAGAIDPVCGMTVEPAHAAGSYTHKGTTYYFCTKRCLEKFRAEPERYLAPAPQPLAPAPAGTRYTCPMHPEIVQ